MTNPLEERGLPGSGQEFHQLFALKIFQLQTLDDFVRVTAFALSDSGFTARFADSYNLSSTS